MRCGTRWRAAIAAFLSNVSLQEVIDGIPRRSWQHRRCRKGTWRPNDG
jgi:hypothetical protein